MGHCEIASWGRTLALATLTEHSGFDELLELTRSEENAAEEVRCAIAEEVVIGAAPAI